MGAEMCIRDSPGPMQAQTDPQARPARSSAFLTLTESMCSGASMGSSTVSNPHFLNLEKRRVLCVVKGDTNRKELMPNLMIELHAGKTYGNRAAGSMPKSSFGQALGQV